MENTTLFLAAYAVFLLVSAGVVLVLWIAMPFSVFGIKGLLRKCIEEQQKTNRLLRTILETDLQREREEREEHKETTH